MIIGITGKIASGKTTVANWLKKQGAFLIDLDLLAKNIYKKATVKQHILQNWNSKLFNKNQEIDTAELRNWIFSNPYHWQKLVKYTEPLIYEELTKFLKKIKEKKWIILDAQILMNSNFASLTDKIIYLQTPKKILIQRRIKTGFTKKQFLFFWKRQPNYKNVKNKVDFLIKNNKSLNDLKIQIKELKKRENWTFSN